MEKFIELLGHLGFPKDTISKIEAGEQIDLKTEAESFLSAKAELVKNDPDFVTKLKSDAKKEGEIIARKKFKKLLNTDFGLGLTETPLNEITDEDLIAKVKDKSASSSNADIQKLQDKIVELSNENTRLQNDKTTEVENVKKEYAAKLKQEKLDKKLAEYVDTLADESNGKGLIVSKATAIRNLKLGIQEAGITDFEFDDKGNITKVLKGDLEALTPDNTRKETLETIGERALSEFFKKSNGSGGSGGAGGQGSGAGAGAGGGGAADGEEIAPELKAHLDRMKEKAGQTA